MPKINKTEYAYLVEYNKRNILSLLKDANIINIII